MDNINESSVCVKKRILKRLYSLSEDGSKIMNSHLVFPKRPIFDVYELIYDANFQQIFNYLEADLSSICLRTQSQIYVFCEKYFEHLSQQGITLFLFKEGEDFLVAELSGCPSNFYINVYHIQDERIININQVCRVIVPINFYNN